MFKKVYLPNNFDLKVFYGLNQFLQSFDQQ